MIIRLANAGDESGLRVLSEQPVNGFVSFGYRAGASFFSSLDVYGGDQTVILAEKEGKILGMGVVAKRLVYVDKTPVTVSYLSSLRIAQSARGGLIMARGFMKFIELQGGSISGLFLTSIMEDNSEARALLTSRRAGLPEYHEIGKYETTIIPLFKRFTKEKNADLEIMTGKEVGWEIVADCLKRFGSAKNFFPAMTTASERERKLFSPQLEEKDFLVVLHRGKVKGVMAIWDQSDYRQLYIAGYSFPGAVFRTVSRLTGIMTGIPGLPPSGQKVKIVYASCVAVEDNNPEIFAPLLREALDRARRKGYQFMATGFFREDLLGEVPKTFFHLTLKSRIYEVRMPDRQTPENRPGSGRLNYLDVGTL